MPPCFARLPPVVCPLSAP